MKFAQNCCNACKYEFLKESYVKISVTAFVGKSLHRKYPHNTFKSYNSTIYLRRYTLRTVPFYQRSVRRLNLGAFSNVCTTCYSHATYRTRRAQISLLSFYCVSCMTHWFCCQHTLGNLRADVSLLYLTYVLILFYDTLKVWLHLYFYDK